MDSACRILGFAADPAGRPLIHHDCTARGAPLPLQENGKWQVAGVKVMAKMSKAEGYAVTLDKMGCRRRPMPVKTAWSPWREPARRVVPSRATERRAWVSAVRLRGRSGRRQSWRGAVADKKVAAQGGTFDRGADGH
jgi:hypothetical protein